MTLSSIDQSSVAKGGGERRGGGREGGGEGRKRMREEREGKMEGNGK